MTDWMQRPDAGEYDAYYAGYVARVPDGDLLHVLEEGIDGPAGLLSLLRPLPGGGASLRYAPGKWSVAEVVGHIVDIERVLATRVLRFARGDDTPLPGVDQDVLVRGARCDERSLASLLAEFEHLRRANLHLFESLDDTALSRRGVADGAAVSVRALVTIVAGHALHHTAVLRERYLVGLAPS